MQIISDEGVGALWNGTLPSLLLVLNPAIQFMIYEGLKRQLRRGIPREVSKTKREMRQKIIFIFNVISGISNADIYMKGQNMLNFLSNILIHENT